jgi:hypothetical protein
MTDGTGSAKDEHLVPGRGTQPCAELLELLASNGFAGAVVIEINTRKAASRSAREDDLAESLAFTRLHFASAAETTPDPAFAVTPDAPRPRKKARRRQARRRGHVS